MTKQPIERVQATQQQIEIVRAASINPRFLVGQENDTMLFFRRCGAKLQLSAGDAIWVETIGKKMGLLESTAEEKAQFKIEAEYTRKNGGRLSQRYWPKWKRGGGR